MIQARLVARERTRADLVDQLAEHNAELGSVLNSIVSDAPVPRGRRLLSSSVSAGMTRDRTIHNDVVSDVASSARVRRGEVLLGVERRRKWSDEMRIAIVAEALEPGVVVSQVARRHDLNPSQLFGWLKHYRAEVMALRSAKSATSAPAFVPAMLDGTDVATTPQVPIIAAGSIEISIGATTVRVHGAADAKTLAVVLKALRSLA